jgi:hypothetical protein
MLIDEFLCKREVLGKRAPHSFTPPLSVVGVSNTINLKINTLISVVNTKDTEDTSPTQKSINQFLKMEEERGKALNHTS